MEMRYIPGSSSIQGAHHDEATGTLTVDFHGGARYEYEGVPKDVADGLFSADSAGKYHASQIARSYKFSRVR